MYLLLCLDKSSNKQIATPFGAISGAETCNSLLNKCLEQVKTSLSNIKYKVNFASTNICSYKISFFKLERIVILHKHLPTHCNAQ